MRPNSQSRIGRKSSCNRQLLVYRSYYRVIGCFRLALMRPKPQTSLWVADAASSSILPTVGTLAAEGGREATLRVCCVGCP
jgi:hypothetical protein